MVDLKLDTTEHGDLMRPTIPPDLEQRVKRVSADLMEIESYLIHADLPREALEALSEAVDKTRSTNWAVLNSTIDQFTNVSQPAMVLTSHRVQRTLALLGEMQEEMDAGRIDSKVEGAGQLLVRLGVTHKKMHYILTGKTAPPDQA